MNSLMCNLEAIAYRRIIKPMLFKLDPEEVHQRATTAGNLMGRSSVMRAVLKVVHGMQDEALDFSVFGLNFRSPIGLSAGFDKDGKLINVIESLGFGYTQVGTVTHGAYEGNAGPRLVRLPHSKGIVVNFGLMGEGVRSVLDRLKKEDETLFPISISIGKTNCTSTATVEAGVSDYVACLKEVMASGIGDMYTLNISCPNTFGGEPFTDAESLSRLLTAVRAEEVTKPILLKMPINLKWDKFREIVDVALEYDVEGLIIGNLQKDRGYPVIKDTLSDEIRGGISGKPTWSDSNDLISRTYKYAGDKIVIVGVGGVFSAEDAYEKIKRGASLVQLITGMIYNGPQLIRQINSDLVSMLKRDGYRNVSDAVGEYHRD